MAKDHEIVIQVTSFPLYLYTLRSPDAACLLIDSECCVPPCCFFLIDVSLSFTVGTIDVGKARLMFWDLGGQEELQSLWDKVS